jgi:hypothetical protein
VFSDRSYPATRIRASPTLRRAARRIPGAVTAKTVAKITKIPFQCRNITTTFDFFQQNVPRKQNYMKKTLDIFAKFT